ncbi:MAG: glutathione S-transferase family protein [Rubrivivax sp.]
MLRLYYAPMTCALATHIVLEHLGRPYEAVRVDFKSQQQRSPEYLAVNPKGRVPALVTGRGVLTETPALLLYLAQTHPEAGLAPLDDPFALAELQAVTSWLCSTVHVAHAHKGRGYRWTDDAAAQAALKEKVPQNMTECFDWVESTVLRGPWVMGERFTVADPYLFTLTNWLPGDGVEVERFPRVADHQRRMLALPAVQRVMALHT